MKWAGHVACRGEMRSVYKAFIGKAEGIRSFGRSRRRWADYGNVGVEKKGR
jgi:hypothetical protein